MDEINLGLIAIKEIVGFIALYIVLNITGRTSISQLTPFHFVFVLLLDDFLGHIIYEKNQSIFIFLYTVGLWTAFMIIIEQLTIRFTKIRFLIPGKPIIVIRNGIIDHTALKHARLDLNQILSMLRQKSVFSVREVEFAIIETNGKISIALKSKYKNPTVGDMNLAEQPVTLPTTLIIEGKIIQDNLKECGFDEKWLVSELNKKGFDLKSVFYAEWESNDGMYICRLYTSPSPRD